MVTCSFCQNFGLYPVMFQSTAKKRNERTWTRNVIRTRHVISWGHDVVRYPIQLDVDIGSIGYLAHICAFSSNPVKVRSWCWSKNVRVYASTCDSPSVLPCLPSVYSNCLPVSVESTAPLSCWMMLRCGRVFDHWTLSMSSSFTVLACCCWFSSRNKQCHGKRSVDADVQYAFVSGMKFSMFL